MGPFVAVVLTYFVALFLVMMFFQLPEVSGLAILGLLLPAAIAVAAFGLLQWFEHREERRAKKDLRRRRSERPQGGESRPSTAGRMAARR